MIFWFLFAWSLPLHFCYDLKITRREVINTSRAKLYLHVSLKMNGNVHLFKERKACDMVILDSESKI